MRSVKKSLKKSWLYFYILNKKNYIYNRYLTTTENVIKKQFKKRLDRQPELSNPVLFTDKLQWLKLNWYDQFAVKMADKYEVRNLVSHIIGDQYLNQLYAVYNGIDEINLSELPESFVLKGTHGSGFNIICKDKHQIDWKTEKNNMKKWLLQNYYWNKREWVYRDIKPRIICEKLLSENGSNSSSLADYKFYCFNGNPYYCQVIRGRGGNETIDFFNLNWEHMPFIGMRLLPNSKEKIEKPESYDEMIKLAEKLSKGFPFVRVDFYYVNNKIYFGEMTFFPTSGMGRFDPPEWNQKLGDLLVLPEI